jgi:hypothetical protein
VEARLEAYSILYSYGYEETSLDEKQLYSKITKEVESTNKKRTCNAYLSEHHTRVVDD